MARIQDIPSNFSTGINDPNGTLVDPERSIGSPFDDAAVAQADDNSAFTLLKGIAAGLNVPAGSGAGDINDAAKLHADPLLTLGDMTDAPAVSTEEGSAISYLKGILAVAGI